LDVKKKIKNKKIIDVLKNNNYFKYAKKTKNINREKKVMTQYSSFRAHTAHGHTIKTLIELLQNSLSDAPLEVSPDGIKLCVFDSHECVAVKMLLKSEQFDEYRCTETQWIGISLKNLHGMLKNVKKKSAVTFFINPNDREHRGYLGVQVLHNVDGANKKTSTLYIKIQTILMRQIDLPTNYGVPDVLSSSDFREMCRDMKVTGSITDVTVTGSHIFFSCEGGNNLFAREEKFARSSTRSDGNNEADVMEDLRSGAKGKKKGKRPVSSSDVIYSDSFTTRLFGQIAKSTGLARIIKIYVQKGNPIRFSMDIGSLGYIDLYIKSVAQVEDELREQREKERESIAEDCVFSDAIDRQLGSSSKVVVKKVKKAPKKAVSLPKKHKKSHRKNVESGEESN
jgi:proliferating cell nuclear antigen PCNA